mmetsp:Transcript_59432/g.69467  ORF Transcript_59432/g.69467 Transcript_59432/m.69467 type:complete len:82 (+) Transcript_59432:2-247(+)
MFLKACACLLQSNKSERDNLVLETVLSCRKDGLFDDSVLKNFNHAASKVLRDNFIRRDYGEVVNIKDLPSDWSSNLPEKIL